MIEAVSRLDRTQLTRLRRKIYEVFDQNTVTERTTTTTYLLGTFEIVLRPPTSTAFTDRPPRNNIPARKYLNHKGVQIHLLDGLTPERHTNLVRGRAQIQLRHVETVRPNAEPEEDFQLSMDVFPSKRTPEYSVFILDTSPAHYAQVLSWHVRKDTGPYIALSGVAQTAVA